jgi:cytochrome c5
VFAVLLFAIDAAAERIPPGTTDEIKARLAPVGEVCKTGESCGQAAAQAGGGAGIGLSGHEIYDKFCFACHMAGVGGAPKVHNAADWAPRVAKGPDALLNSMLHGLNAMPQKGTCMACSEAELKSAMEFMSGK